LLQNTLEKQTFKGHSFRAFFDVVFDRLKRLNLLLQDTESTFKSPKSKLDQLYHGLAPEMTSIIE
jgi:hypothetical protein